ncbi:MAG TPA: chemotaxis protein CheW, partial [Candidatus Caenarcaniphilales bacterium]
MASNFSFLTQEQQNELPEAQTLESRSGKLHLRFYTCCAYEFALPAVGIREVLSTSPDRITPIPNTSPLLLGTINFRGQAVWVADLGQFLGEADYLNTDRAEIPVIAIEDQEVTVGLAVDRIVGMDWLDPDEVQISTNISDNLAPFLKGEWLVDKDTHQWV